MTKELHERLSRTDTPWVDMTYANDWQDYPGGAYSALQYRKVGDVVHVRGAIESTTVPTASETITTLPTGFRPPGIVPVLCRANGLTVGAVDVLSTGVIRWRSGDEAFLYIDVQFSISA